MNMITSLSLGVSILTNSIPSVVSQSFSINRHFWHEQCRKSSNMFKKSTSKCIKNARKKGDYERLLNYDSRNFEWQEKLFW